MIPDYYDGMFLPAGEPTATWPEIADRFGSNDHRRRLLLKLKGFVDSAKRCGVIKVYLFGSFISNKPEPRDVDLLWIHEPNLDYDGLSVRCRELLNYAIMKEREGWDMFCCSNEAYATAYFLGAWGRDKGPERKERGIIELHLSTL